MRPLNSYSVKDAEIILATYFPNAPHGNLPQDETGQYDLSVYPLKPLDPYTFLEDALNYFLSCGNKLRNRRACFLLATQKSFLTIIIEYSQLDEHLAKRLRLLIPGQSLSTVLQNRQWMSEFKNLYQQIQCIVIGAISPVQSALITQLKQPLGEVTALSPSIQWLVSAPNHSTLYTVDQTIAWMLRGKTQDRSAQEIFITHREKLVQSVIMTIEKIKTKNLIQYRTVLKYLTVLIKYLLLNIQRSRYSSERTLQTDTEIKIEIYQHKITDLARYLNLLTITPLTKMLAVKDKTDSFIKMLEQACQQELTKLRAWETIARSHFQNPLKTSLQIVYQYSLLQFASDSVPVMINALLRTTHQRSLLKVLGFILGLTYHYYLGFYESLRMVGVLFVASQLNNLLGRLSLNDRDASLNFPVPNTLNCVRLFSLLLAGIEIYWTGKYYFYLIPTAGGIGASFLATHLYHKVCRPSDTTPIALFFLGLCVHNLGHSLTHFIMNWYLAPPLHRFSYSQALQLLGLPNSASQHEIRKRRNELALKYHPDKCGQQCTMPIADINDAYQTLIRN